MAFLNVAGMVMRGVWPHADTRDAAHRTLLGDGVSLKVAFVGRLALHGDARTLTVAVRWRCCSVTGAGRRT